MAIIPSLDRISSFLKKYKYALLVLIIGLALTLIPKASPVVATEINRHAMTTEADFENKLADLLSNIDGAGEVRVILTKLHGEETLYQMNDDISESSDSKTHRSDTVTVTDAERNETGLIRQVTPATYKGAIILCQGADSPSVKYEIINAVSKLIGIGTNCISVLKMK